MTDNIKEKLLSSKGGSIAVLIFAVYTFAWAVIEPLNLDWINSNKIVWRVILITFSVLVAFIYSFRLSSSLLDYIDADSAYRKLQDSYSSHGSPQMDIVQDGQLGNIVNIRADFSDDECDWLVRSSAQKAKKIELIFKNRSKFNFYLKVGMTSQNGRLSTTRWIRFDDGIILPDQYINNTPELGVPYNSTPLYTLNKAVIDIPNAVRQSFGQDGWVYNKIMIFRIRCYDATIKSLSFKR